MQPLYIPELCESYSEFYSKLTMWFIFWILLFNHVCSESQIYSLSPTRRKAYLRKNASSSTLNQRTCIKCADILLALHASTLSLFVIWYFDVAGLMWFSWNGNFKLMSLRVTFIFYKGICWGKGFEIRRYTLLNTSIQVIVLLLIYLSGWL